MSASRAQILINRCSGSVTILPSLVHSDTQLLADMGTGLEAAVLRLQQSQAALEREAAATRLLAGALDDMRQRIQARARQLDKRRG
jgi:hypothetical protein